MRTSTDVRWVSVAAAAEELGVSKARVRQLARSGALARQLSGSTVLISVASIEARIAKLQKEGAGDGSDIQRI